MAARDSFSGSGPTWRGLRCSNPLGELIDSWVAKKTAAQPARLYSDNN